MITISTRASIPLLLLALASACHREQTTEPPTGGDTTAASEPVGYPGELIATADMGKPFLARQKLKGRFGEQEFAFEAVLQLHGGTLTVLGLTPFGTKAFVLKQTGTAVEFEPLIDREMPFPPEYMLQDIHRAWLWHVRLPWGDARPAQLDGSEASFEVAGERVIERWGNDGLMSRSFVRLDGQPPGEIRVEYTGGQRAGDPAKHVILDNGWFGYRLEIETTDWRWL